MKHAGRADASPNGPPRAAGLRAGKLAGLLGYWMRRAQVVAFQDFASTFAGHELTPGQLGALLLIEANQGLSQTALGRALGIERSSVVPLIDRLQRRALVRRAVHAADRRAHALELSPAGVELLARLARPLEAHERRIAAGLSPAERRMLIALLARVAA